MKVPYCLPIIKQDQSEILAIIQNNLSDYRYFEIWLDYAYQADETFVKKLQELLDERLIILFRRQNLEPIIMTIERRHKILNILSNTPVLVDIDITQDAEFQYITEHSLAINLIASYHNYQQTPDTVQLQTIIDTMSGYQPAIYKLSTLCKGPEDSLRLMQLLLELKNRGLTVIVSGMGEHGSITRVFGGLWGNAMTFAPLLVADQSAPGQLTRQQLETIYKQLES